MAQPSEIRDALIAAIVGIVPWDKPTGRSKHDTWKHVERRPDDGKRVPDRAFTVPVSTPPEPDETTGGDDLFWVEFLVQADYAITDGVEARISNDGQQIALVLDGLFRVVTDIQTLTVRSLGASDPAPNRVTATWSARILYRADL